MRTAHVLTTRSDAPLCFIPELLPDECLYSFLQRIWSLNAFTLPRQFMLLLFGCDSHIPVLDLPTGLDALQRTLGERSPFKSADDLIDRATLYPYHRPFLSVSRDTRLVHLFRGTGGQGVKTLLGRVANGFGAQVIARYCVLCNTSTAKQYGCTYWQRSHQLPGVVYCTVHGIQLEVFSGLSCLSHRQQLQQSPWSSTFEPTYIARESHNYQLALMSVALLKANLYISDVSALNLVYISKILSLGFKKAHGKIDFPALTDALREYYNQFQGFEHRERLLSSSNHPLFWLYSTLRRPERSSHPICHLLLIRFLFGSIEKFLGTFNPSKNNMADRWRTQENDTLPRRTIVVPRHPRRDTTFSNQTEFGQATSERLESTSSAVAASRQTIEMTNPGHCHRVPEVIRLAIVTDLCAGLAIAEISKKHSVSISVAYRIRAHTPGLKQLHADHKIESERITHRQHWLALCKKLPAKGVTMIRATAPGAYAWLRRNDQQWLKDVCSTLPRALTSPRNSKVDWAKRDQSLAEQAQQFVRNERTRINRSRISATLILRHLNREAMVRANRERLPTLNNTLIELSESIEQFQKFRIDLAIDKLRRLGLLRSRWRIQRLAGLKNWTPSLSAYAISRGIDMS
ncbi:TniQ protein [Pollutimonas bauzanensis]|uniref:TniQ protein n=1 Tax=Pollutimonas bauzanensis TaxID=658167 RepID=A0A1M5PN49_9BURK|nr:TniQ protein [Pollutimonas bauzanensis]SHH34492.1 TniQ protein [Pollutimonas bauzanensis]